MESAEYEISLGELFGILKRRWPLIVLTTLSTTLIAFCLSMYVLTPMYETSATMIVSYKQNQESVMTYNDVVMSQNLVNTYSEIIKSRRVLDQVIEELDLSVSPHELAEGITVSPRGDTEIIEVTVSDASPSLATDIANQVSAVFQKEIQDMMEVDSVETIDHAIEPKNPVSPNIMMNTLIGGLLGGVISVLLAFSLAFMDRTLKTPQDIERYLGLPIIGAIPDLALENMSGGRQ